MKWRNSGSFYATGSFLFCLLVTGVRHFWYGIRLPVVNVILIYEEYFDNRGGYAFYNASVYDSRRGHYSMDTLISQNET